MQPRIYELENVNVDIKENHIRALRAEQANAARGANPSRHMSLFYRLEHGFGRFLIDVGERFAPRPALPERSVTKPSVR